MKAARSCSSFPIAPCRPAAECFNQKSGLGLILVPLDEFSFGAEPVLHRLSVPASAGEIQLVGTLGDAFTLAVARGRLADESGLRLVGRLVHSLLPHTLL